MSRRRRDGWKSRLTAGMARHTRPTPSGRGARQSGRRTATSAPERRTPSSSWRRPTARVDSTEGLAAPFQNSPPPAAVTSPRRAGFLYPISIHANLADFGLASDLSCTINCNKRCIVTIYVSLYVGNKAFQSEIPVIYENIDHL